GESHSANSAASLTTPRQSALGFPEVGGGDGQLRNGDSPTATARTSTFTSNTTGTAAGPGTLTVPASRPCRPGGYPPAATHNPDPTLRPAPRYGAGAPPAAPPTPPAWPGHSIPGSVPRRYADRFPCPKCSTRRASRSWSSSATANPTVEVDMRSLYLDCTSGCNP